MNDVLARCFSAIALASMCQLSSLKHPKVTTGAISFRNSSENFSKMGHIVGIEKVSKSKTYHKRISICDYFETKAPQRITADLCLWEYSFYLAQATGKYFSWWVTCSLQLLLDFQSIFFNNFFCCNSLAMVVEVLLLWHCQSKKDK